MKKQKSEVLSCCSLQWEEEGGKEGRKEKEETFSGPRSQKSDPVSPHLRVAVASHDWTVKPKTKAAAAAAALRVGVQPGDRGGGGGVTAVRGQRTLTSFPRGEALPSLNLSFRCRVCQHAAVQLTGRCQDTRWMMAVVDL